MLFFTLKRIFIQLNEVQLETYLLIQTAFNKHSFTCGKDSFASSVVKQKAIQFKFSIFDLPQCKTLKITKISRKIN